MNQRTDRRGPFHSIGEPGVEGNLRRLPDGANKQAKGNRRRHFRGQLIDLTKHLGIVQGLKIDENKENGQEEPGVSNSVHHKGLGRRLRRRDPVEVVPNEEIGAEPDALPPDEEHQIIVPHHQEEHRHREQIHVREEARVAFFPMHIPNRVHVNQETHPSDDQKHDSGQRIYEKPEIDVQIPAEDPGVRNHFPGRSCGHHFSKHHKRAEKR